MEILTADRSDWNESKARNIAGVISKDGVILAEIKTKHQLAQIIKSLKHALQSKEIAITIR